MICDERVRESAQGRLHRRATVVTAIASLGVAILLGLLSGSRASTAEAADATSNELFFLPLIVEPATCTGASANVYTAGAALQFDPDDPVRFAYEHADKNLALRGYSLNTDTALRRELLDFGKDDPTQPPQIATLFSPARVPPLLNFYRVGQWIWASPPDPGHRGDPVTSPPVTALGLASVPGEPLHVPTSGYNIGGGMEVMVIFADEDTVALRYTREDSSGAPGYTLHVDNICTDPNLLALYESLDDPFGPRYVYAPPWERPYSYNLPNLPAGKPFGTARYGEIVVAIVDTGTFMDTRSCNAWWQIRPGHGACPQP
jgi:hypothetical protein